jgi:metal-sulfur cluster biosynthetic enzyme/rhodanese-related sulfurtransferase
MIFLIGSVALGFAIVAWRLARRLGIAERELREVRLLGRELEELRDEGGRALAVTRAHLAAVAAGEPPERNAILRGIAYRDVQPAEALALYDGSPGLVVVDVRTREEYASGHIPRALLIPLDELEHRLGELPPRDAPILVHCAAGGRSAAACQLLGRYGYTRLLNLVGGLHAWPGPRAQDDGTSGSPGGQEPAGRPAVTFRGGPVSDSAVVAAIRECFDPEVPVNIYDLGLIYGIDIAPGAIAVRMTLTSEACPSARAIPEEVKQRIVALGQPNVTVEVVWDPPWHPSRISPEGKQKLGLV